MQELIKTEGLTKRYEGFNLDDVTLDVQPGTVVGIIGENGAGKTTLINAILGIIDPDAGSASVFGHSLNGSDKEIDAIKQRIGIVLDTCAFLVTMRVCDVASLGHMAYTEWDQGLFAELCEHFDLEPKKQVKELSRGMGMKLSLAFALAHHPDLLILDEATAGLDPISRDAILDVLRNFMEDESHAILMATHITTDLEKIADEVVLINDGHILFSMPKERICDEAGIAHCRASDLEKVVSSGFFENGNPNMPKMIRRGYSIDLLVPDRFAFARAFPDLPTDHASIEEYMTLILKGESL